MKNGVKLSNPINNEIRVYEERMQHHNKETNIRTGGVHIPPALHWDRKFQEMRLKMEESIGKLSTHSVDGISYMCVHQLMFYV